ncbi:unnamed protein product [Heligmosomoides polygyrus]|uniref:GHL10 domain-containing protein n=1 Tax=Heligmosomoides polygyrus TaxID=6339 RepID=A0A183GTL4_HELPZ|nr:unnamed protein product [Heligmosomoides polygyrus]
MEKEYNFQVALRWILRMENNDADWASRLIDYDDWRISDRIFKAVTDKWGTPSIDMFANDRNAKCNVYFSRYQCPGTSGTDAFAHSQPWKDGLLWLVPPVNLISKTIKWARSNKSVGILGCPMWDSQPYFPMLKPYGLQWASFIKDGVLWPTGTKLFKDPSLPGAFGSQFTRSPLVFSS